MEKYIILDTTKNTLIMWSRNLDREYSTPFFVLNTSFETLRSWQKKINNNDLKLLDTPENTLILWQRILNLRK